MSEAALPWPAVDATRNVRSRAGQKHAISAPERARVARVRTRLAEVYGVPELPPHGRPIAALVLTVLSPSTNNRHRDAA